MKTSHPGVGNTNCLLSGNMAELIVMMLSEVGSARIELAIFAMSRRRHNP